MTVPIMDNGGEVDKIMGDCVVVVTEDIIRDLEVITPHHRWIDQVQVKGSSRRLRLFEIYGHQPEVGAGTPHRHASDDLMDNILRHYPAHCTAWSAEAGAGAREIDLWEGVHVFYEK